VSTAAAATATVSPWVPVIAASVGAAAALIVGVLTQLWSGRRERQQWERERKDRQQQWERERASRWLQDRQQTYARLLAALHEWDDFLTQAVTKRQTDLVIGEHTSLDKAGYDAAAKAVMETLPLVEFMASSSVFTQTVAVVTGRQALWFLSLTAPPDREIDAENDREIDAEKLGRDMAALMVKKSLLVAAMRKDLGVVPEQET
jgi:hypothetical protein